MNQTDLLDLSQQLLLAIKLDKNTLELRNKLNDFTLQQLKNEIYSDDLKKTFWINIYNAFFLILKKEFNHSKPNIYRKKLFNIANIKFSLDDVEHGILRKYRYKYSLGFLRNIFYSKLIKNLAVNTIDYRIHFALNCGAKSCPPIAFYKLETINNQLNTATVSFLESETDYNNTNKEIHITSLFKWYLMDFGGNKGIQNIYKNQLNKDITDYKIIYKEYSWDEDLNNFL